MAAVANQTQDGPRMTKLRQALDKALEKLQEGASLSKLPLDVPEALRTILLPRYEQMLSGVIQNIKTEFDCICEETNVREAFRLLDESIAASKGTKRTHALQGGEDRQAGHVAQAKANVHKRLKHELEELEKGNAELVQKVASVRAAVDEAENVLSQQTELEKAAIVAEQGVSESQLRILSDVLGGTS